jgi:hypothetical protein
MKNSMDIVGKLLKWRIVSFTKSACQLGWEGKRTGCQLRDELFFERAFAGEFDLVITVQTVNSSLTEAKYVSVFDKIVTSGTPVATFRDNPVLDEATLECKRVNFSDPNLCQFTPKIGFRKEDKAVNAATSLGLHIIDLSAVFCHDNVCPLAIGGMSIYRDDDHVNRDFLETLAPLIAANLAGARLIRTE